MSLTRGYHNYRGRTPRWKIFLAVLLVVVILAAGVIMGLQRYIVYDANGRPHLELPQEEAEETVLPEAEDLDLTIETGKKAPAALQGVDFSAGLTQTIWQQGAAARAEGAYNAAVLTGKDPSGAIWYDSAAAAGVGASVQSAALTPALLEQIRQELPYTVARLSCFLDPETARSHVEDMGLKNTGGYIFYDESNRSWLDPGKPQTRSYLCALAKELAELGFDEILLTEFTYPTAGKLDKINYGETMKTENLSAFLEELRTALEGYEVKLSLELPANVILEGSDHVAGLKLEDLAPAVDRIYAAATAEQAPALAEAVHALSESTDFVPELPAEAELPESGSSLRPLK